MLLGIREQFHCKIDMERFASDYWPLLLYAMRIERIGTKRGENFHIKESRKVKDHMLFPLLLSPSHAREIARNIEETGHSDDCLILQGRISIPIGFDLFYCVRRLLFSSLPLSLTRYWWWGRGRIRGSSFRCIVNVRAEVIVAVTLTISAKDFFWT